MFAFYIWDFRKRKKYIILGCISLLLLVGLFFFLYSNSNLFFEEDKEVALTKGNVKNNKVALTFNVSWGDEKETVTGNNPEQVGEEAARRLMERGAGEILADVKKELGYE